MAKPNVSTTAVALTAEYDGPQGASDEDVWCNATSAAADCGKRPIDWLRLRSTKVLMHEIESFSGLAVNELVRTRRGRPHGEVGTWLHPLLAGHFLHWLKASPGFVYAALFDDGAIKVGRSGDAGARLATHAVSASRRQSALTDSCVSAFLPDCHWAERCLIAFCRKRGKIARGKEMFSDLSFDEVAAFISSISTPQN